MLSKELHTEKTIKLSSKKFGLKKKRVFKRHKAWVTRTRPLKRSKFRWLEHLEGPPGHVQLEDSGRAGDDTPLVFSQFEKCEDSFPVCPDLVPENPDYPGLVYLSCAKTPKVKQKSTAACSRWHHATVSGVGQSAAACISDKFLCSNFWFEPVLRHNLNR